MSAGRPAKETRTKKDRAAAVGISYRRWRQLETEDGGFAKLIASNATDEDILNYIESRKRGYLGIDKDTVMSRRREAEMNLAEEKAALAEIERRKAERELIEATEVMRFVGRAMQTIKNNLNNIPAKVRLSVQANSEPAVVEELVAQEIKETLRTAAAQMREIE